MPGQGSQDSRQQDNRRRDNKTEPETKQDTTPSSALFLFSDIRDTSLETLSGFMTSSGFSIDERRELPVKTSPAPRVSYCRKMTASCIVLLRVFYILSCEYFVLGMRSLTSRTGSTESLGEDKRKENSGFPEEENVMPEEDSLRTMSPRKEKRW